MKSNRLNVIAVLTVLFVLVSAGFAEMPSQVEYTNSMGMKFMRIEPGSFTMGVGETPLPLRITQQRGTQEYGDFDERPNHKVTITKPFYMGAFEVTNKQYELFDPSHKKLRGKEGLSLEDDDAVINVNWYDAQKFCMWLSDKEGMPYRLATEAEWEYACRAGTTTHYHTGNLLPKEFLKNATMAGGPVFVPTKVGQTIPNAWGLYDMHGNVEEWVNDWYGPYKKGSQKDPVGYVSGDFRVTRGGSHGTDPYYLRSANRLGTVPEDKHWLIGFRVVIGEMPKSKPLDLPEVPLNQQGVIQRDPATVLEGPDPEKAYFKGPRQYVNIDRTANGPIFASHNHCPASVECPNGDLLALWYTGIGERERNMAVCASRLRYGADQWEPASPFWDPPDRNDTALSAWYDDKDTIYHFNSLSISSNWQCMAAVMRTSTDSGATWSSPRLILPEHDGSHQVSEPVFRRADGAIAITHDGAGTIWASKDNGLTWVHMAGKIQGNHPGGVQLDDGRIYGLGRGGDIDGRMPVSISVDGGETFKYSASEFHPIGGGQRLAMVKLREGPIFVASFGNLYGVTTNPVMVKDTEGNEHPANELFAAVSFDGGKTWPYKKIVAPEGDPIFVESTDGSVVTVSGNSSEHRGYLTVCQGTDGLINLFSSRQHYAFNLKWVTTPAPPPPPLVRIKHEVETFTGPDFDLDNWKDYKGYSGGFNGKGKYTINSIIPYGGINRVVGAGSFDATFEIDNMEYHPGYRWREMAFGLKDKFARTWFLVVAPDHIGMYFKDMYGKPDTRGDRVKVPAMPRSIKMRFTYNEKTKQCRVFYGLNGDDPKMEMPLSQKGLYLKEPFSESNAAYVLISEGTVEVDRFEIKPLEE